MSQESEGVVSEDSESDEDVLKELADRREELDAHGVVRDDPFIFVLRGGMWTHAHHGVAYDSYRAHARPGRPTTFCVVHGLPKSATFSNLEVHRGALLLSCAALAASHAVLV